MAEPGAPEAAGAPAPGVAPYRPWVRRLVQDHPGALLTVLYLVLTSVGLVYTYAYYARFRVNVLDYADTSDFLLAALREPLAILLALLPALAILVIVRVHRVVLPRSARYQAFFERREAVNERRYYRHLGGRARYLDVSNTLLVVSYAGLFTLFYGRGSARRVKQGDGTRVRVVLVAGDAAIHTAGARAPMLVGTTARYVFLYVPEQDSTYVVPTENVALIAIEARRERREGSVQHLLEHLRPRRAGAPPLHDTTGR